MEGVNGLCHQMILGDLPLHGARPEAHLVRVSKARNVVAQAWEQLLVALPVPALLCMARPNQAKNNAVLDSKWGHDDCCRVIH